MTPFAGSLTYTTLDATRTIKASGGLHIYGIVVTNVSGSTDTITFTDKDSNELLAIRHANNTTTVVPIPWLADNGLLVSAGTPNAGHIVTVFHSNLQGGA